MGFAVSEIRPPTGPRPVGAPPPRPRQRRLPPRRAPQRDPDAQEPPEPPEVDVPAGGDPAPAPPDADDDAPGAPTPEEHVPRDEPGDDDRPHVDIRVDAGAFQSAMQRPARVEEVSGCPV